MGGWEDYSGVMAGQTTLGETNMDYIEQSRYDAIATLSARIYETNYAMRAAVSLKEKMELLHERDELIKQRAQLL